MYLGFSFITGMKVGIEFPWEDGLYFVIDLLIIRIIGYTDEEDEDE